MENKPYHKYIFDEENRKFIGTALEKLALIKLFLPDNPIGFVKSNDDILLEFSKYYDVIHHIDIHSMQQLVLFGKSKAI